MSQEIQEAVYKQQEVIKDKQLSVKVDLDQVEPAVIEAQNGTVLTCTDFLSEVHICIILRICCHNDTSARGARASVNQVMLSPHRPCVTTLSRHNPHPC